ncbi:MAG: hypothetical protein HGA53_06420 [Anaerolineaceae bacterium]|nr:hypothetical protein [Anaerolineaceae bacterium]
MDWAALQPGYFLAQALSILVLIAWPVLIISTLLMLKRRKLTSNLKALWALMIIAIPIFGAIAFLIIQPTENTIPS